MKPTKTRSRYLLSSQSSGYLEKSESNATIASTCLKYLSSDCFSQNLSDQEMLDGIIRGSYVLQGYVVSHWLEHLIKVSSLGVSSQRLHEISHDITKMIEKRSNPEFNPPQAKSTITYSFEVFENLQSDFSDTLKQVYTFHRRKERDSTQSQTVRALHSV